MCIRSELEQLGLVLLAAFVILVSEGVRYRDVGVLPRDVRCRGPQRYTATFIIYTTDLQIIKKKEMIKNQWGGGNTQAEIFNL